MQPIAKTKDELKRNFYIKEVVTKYSIYESVFYRELEKWTGERSRVHHSVLREPTAPDSPVPPRVWEPIMCSN